MQSPSKKRDGLRVHVRKLFGKLGTLHNLTFTINAKNTFLTLSLIAVIFFYIKILSLVTAWYAGTMKVIYDFPEKCTVRSVPQLVLANHLNYKCHAFSRMKMTRILILYDCLIFLSLYSFPHAC